MGSDQNLWNRKGVWYCRRQAPKDIEHLYKGKEDIRRSLRTRDIREARRRLHGAMATLDAEFEAKRREMNRDANERAFVESPRFQRLQEDTYNAATRVHVLRGWGEWDAETGTWADFPNDRTEALALVGEALQEVNYWLAQGIDLARGVDEDGEPLWGCPAWAVEDLQKLAHEYFDSKRKTFLAFKAQLSEQEGGVSPAEDGLDALVPIWIKNRRMSKPGTISEMNVAVRIFNQVNGTIPYGSITAIHARQFKDHLLDLDKAVASLKKHWTFVRTLLNVAKDNALIQHNPMDDVRFNPAGESKKRDDFMPYDLIRVFECLDKGSPDWWEFRIILYTGARQGEVHQLVRSDIRREEGIPYFDFNEEGNGKSLKTRSSKRRVPIHRQLIADGLLDWLPESGPLFHGTKQAADKRILRAIRAAKLEGNKVIHSARHTFKTASRKGKIAEEIHDRLTGHTPNNVSRGYGSDDLLPTLKEAIDKIRFGIEMDGGT